MTRSQTYILTALTSLMLLAPGHHAHAENRNASLYVQGSLPSVCNVDIAGSQNKTFGNIGLEQAGNLVIPVHIDCNVPIAGTLQVQNGGFVNNVARYSSNYTNGHDEIDYQMEADLGPVHIGPGPSDDFTTPYSFNSNDQAMGIQDGNITLSWGTVDKLYAGDYSETLVLNILPLNP